MMYMNDTDSHQDSAPFFRFNHHRVDGSVSFSRQGEYVTVTCHWPYDLDIDDWIDIRDTYLHKDYTGGVAQFLATGNRESMVSLVT